MLEQLQTMVVVKSTLNYLELCTRKESNGFLSRLPVSDPGTEAVKFA